MRLAFRFLCGFLALGLLITPLLILSWWLTIFSLLAVGYVLIAKYFDKVGGAVSLGVLTIVTLIALHHYGVLPAESRTTSCDASLTAKVRRSWQSSFGVSYSILHRHGNGTLCLSLPHINHLYAALE